MRTIAFLNQKGGVGKTTSVVNIGALLAHEYHKKVLLIDIDPQGNMTDHLGLDPMTLERSVYDIIIDGATPEEIVQSAHGVDFIPAGIDLAGAEVELATLKVRETRLRNAMRRFCQNYDFVIIDCPPSLGLLTLSALTLATEVVVPMQAEYLALRGLSQLARTVELVRERFNPKLQISGVLFCQYNAQANLSQEVRDEVREHFGATVFNTMIRRNIRLAESPSHGVPTLLYDKTCAGVQDYRALAAEFLQRRAPESDLTELVELRDEAADDAVEDVPHDVTPHNRTPHDTMPEGMTPSLSAQAPLPTEDSNHV